MVFQGPSPGKLGLVRAKVHKVHFMPLMAIKINFLFHCSVAFKVCLLSKLALSRPMLGTKNSKTA